MFFLVEVEKRHAHAHYERKVTTCFTHRSSEASSDMLELAKNIGGNLGRALKTEWFSQI